MGREKKGQSKSKERQKDTKERGVKKMDKAEISPRATVPIRKGFPI